MDTYSNIPAEKPIVRVEILHLDELGYGPQGKHTRREWRAECLENLLAGKEQFESWQIGIRDQINSDLPLCNFENKLTSENRNEDGYALLDRSASFTLDFVGCVFENEINLANYTFEFPISFNRSQFYCDISFSEASFLKRVDFESSLFYGVVFCRQVVFNSLTRFMNSIFYEAAIFSDSIFIEQAQFEKVKFKDNGYFDGVSFSDAALYSFIEADHWMIFKETKFNEADFRYVILNYSDFQKARFEGEVNFRSATFLGDSSFENTNFQNKCFFSNSQNDETKIWDKETTFNGEVYFENAKFENPGHFERVHFVKATPSFRGCKISDTRLEFSDDSYFPFEENTEDAIKNISFLKRLSEEHGQTDQALNFNAMELRAKRLQITPHTATVSFRIITWLYEKLSDFGRSFTKPIVWYCVLICASALLAMVYSTYSDSPAAEQQVLCKPIKDQPPPLKLPYGRAVAEYAMFRAGGLMDFTDTGKQNNAVNCRLFEEPIEPPLMRAWGILKGIASIALLFLAALGLRNKYRIK